jgi:hypothetical protein
VPLPCWQKIINFESVQRCVSLIYEDRALRRTRAHNVRQPGQPKHRSADTLAAHGPIWCWLIWPLIDSFYQLAICGGNRCVRSCVAGPAPRAAIDINILYPGPQRAFIGMLYQLSTCLGVTREKGIAQPGL